MANIADNKFYMSWDSDYDISPTLNQIAELFDRLEGGGINYETPNFIEGKFNSKWAFPFSFWNEVLKNKPIYFRCLTEEYGMGVVSMNIHTKDGTWKESQYFDL